MEKCFFCNEEAAGYVCTNCKHRFSEYIRKKRQILQQNKAAPALGLAGLLCMAVIALFLFNYGQPVEATIQVPTQVTFHGANLQVAGTVSAACHCRLAVKINNQSATVNSDGTFSVAIPIDATSDAGQLTVTALTHGTYLNFSTKSATTTATYTREESPCYVIEKPKEWGQQQIIFKVACDVSSPSETASARQEWQITSAFDAGHSQEIVPVPVLMQLPGYAKHTEVVTIKNLGYDPKRVAKEAMQAAGAPIEQAKAELRPIFNELSTYQDKWMQLYQTYGAPRGGLDTLDDNMNVSMQYGAIINKIKEIHLPLSEKYGALRKQYLEQESSDPESAELKLYEPVWLYSSALININPFTYEKDRLSEFGNVDGMRRKAEALLK